MLTQQKTSAPVDIPLIPKLREIIDATPLAALPTFLVTKKGQPFGPTKSNAHFGKWCNEAGVPRDCEFHGLRYSAAKQLADAGCATV